MDRETKPIVTSNSHTVTLKTYITGREQREISAVFLRDVAMTQAGKEAALSGFKGTLIHEAENKALELVVVDLDSSPDDLVNRILELPAQDYQDIVNAVNEVTQGKKNE
jgi:hypothetical protein